MATSRTGTSQWKKVVTEVRATALDQGLTRCPRCRTGLDWEYSKRPNSAEVDHVIAHALGGPDTVENSRILCRKCNQELGGALTRRHPRPKVETVTLETSPIW